MRILTLTSLYPNDVQPNLGVFVENRLVRIHALGGIDIRVIAPVPWFPFRHPAFGGYGGFARVARTETSHGLAVAHPRVPVIPKLGMTLAPTLLYLALRPRLAALLREGWDFDLIDAHYFYPDGVAAASLARHFAKPLVITARGSDLNVIARQRLPRQRIRRAAEAAGAVIAVSEALKRRMLEIGITPSRVHVLRNGVDLALFRPPPEPPARERGGPQLLSVGNLVPVKGHERTLATLVLLPDAQLTVVGQGGEEAALRRRAHELGVGARVRFAGAIAHRDLPPIYGAADVLVHASLNEGWPNVLLEALACGTPVVATAVGGTAEIVSAAIAGRTVPADAAPGALAAAVREVLAQRATRAAVRGHATQFGWDEIAERQLVLYREVAGA